MSTDASAGRLVRFGLDLVIDWPDGVTCALSTWRDGRDGVRGELTVRLNGVRLSWGQWTLGSTAARDSLAKRLSTETPEIPWRAHLEEAAWRFTETARVGEPLTTLTGQTVAGPELLLPGWLYAGEPTLLYADGDTGKSLTALTLAVAMQTGCALPGGLLPVRPASAAYLDWETSPATMDARLARVAAGLGVTPPPLLYKRMTRPLVDEASRLATEFAIRHVGLVVIDSQMFAVGSTEGGFHEPMTALYGALRLFAPAAALVLNHVTSEDARTEAPARPFGGAFAFNGPRLIWEAKRDREVEDATAIVFTCRKANNLARKPPPFGLQFIPRPDSSIHVATLDLAGVSPGTLAGAPLTERIQALLSGQEPMSVESMSELLHAKAESIGRILRRLKGKYLVTQLEDARWVGTGQVSGQPGNLSGQPDQRPAHARGVPPPAPPIRTTGTTRSIGHANTQKPANSTFRADNPVRTTPDSPESEGIEGRIPSDREEPAWITEDA